MVGDQHFVSLDFVLLLAGQFRQPRGHRRWAFNVSRRVPASQAEKSTLGSAEHGDPVFRPAD